MRVLHLSYSDNVGGAAIAVRRLNDAMNGHRIESSILTVADLQASYGGRKGLLEKWLFRFREKKHWREFNRQFAEYKVTGVWNDNWSQNLIADLEPVRSADVIYIHWIGRNFISIPEIGRILDSGKKVVWFLHDMWPMTGGCHYSLGCDNYKEHCGACPLLESQSQNDISWQLFERKITHLHGRGNLAVVAPSNWLAKCAAESRILRNQRIETIPNAIDIEVFSPVSKNVAREALRLPSGVKLILFGCYGGTNNFYKGWGYLKDAISLMDASDVELVVFGREESLDVVSQCKFKVHFLGRLSDERISLPLAYSAADVFVNPSIAENFCQTMCEASSCGTPVVCFDIGGNSDIVVHKKTGYLAHYKSSDDLAQGLRWVIEQPSMRELSQNARRHIEQLCSSDEIIAKHRRLWDSF